MKGWLVFKDGRRKELASKYVGCQRFHQPHRGPDGVYLETIFEADAHLEDGAILYRETETRDMTEAYARAAQENDRRTWDVIRRGIS